MKSITKSERIPVESIQIGLASPEKIRQWADRILPNGKIVGQITNSQTVNYKTLRPVKGGIFCERIFGPIKDFECACGRKKDKLSKKFCPDCDVEYTSSRIRRSRLGYIQLISPVTHVWYFRGRINYISNLLNLPRKRVEAVTYCTEKLEVSETEILTFSFLPPMIGRKGYFKNLPTFFFDTEETTVKVIPNKTIEETIFSEKIKNDAILPSTVYVEQKSEFDGKQLGAPLLTPDTYNRKEKTSHTSPDIPKEMSGDVCDVKGYQGCQRIFKKFSHQRVLPISQKFPWQSEKDRNLFLGYITCSPKEGDIPIPTYFSPCSASALTPFRVLEGGENLEINVSNVSLTDIETVLKVLANTGAFAISKRLSELELVVLDQILKAELSETKSEISQLENQVFLLLVDHRRLQRWFARRSKIIRRLILVRDFLDSKARPEWMTLSTIPVLPPDLRPIIQLDGDQVAISDLNKLYQNIFFRNKRFRRTNIENALYAQRLLQEAVDALIENGKGGSDPICASNDRPLKSLSDVLKGKKGRFRQNLLGKRVDYSGRSVIVVGPTLKLHQCGLPKEMAVELFQPFLIRQLVEKKIVPTILTAKNLIHNQDPILWEVLQQVMESHPILLNRAPTLHRLGIQAFQPKLINGRAILLHPLVCPAFNADFDGDQMAVHVPLYVQARAEAWRLMWSRNNLLSPATGQPIIVPSQDMVLGCSYLTTFNSNSQSTSVIEQSKWDTSILSEKQRQLASNIAITSDINKKPNFVSAALTSYTEKSSSSAPYTKRKDIPCAEQILSGCQGSLGVSGEKEATPFLLQKGSKVHIPLGMLGDVKKEISRQNTKTKKPIISDNKFQYFAKQNKDSKILTSLTNQRFLPKEGSTRDLTNILFGSVSEKQTTNITLMPSNPFLLKEGSDVSDKRVLRKYGQYFSDFNDLLKAYYQNKIDLHASVWVRKNGLLETEKSLESPLEIRVNSFGQYNQIFSTYQYEYDLNGQKIKQYVRTTPGRVLLNQVIFT